MGDFVRLRLRIKSRCISPPTANDSRRLIYEHAHYDDFRIG